MKLHIPGSGVRHYGSSLTGFGLNSCDLNLDLQIPSEIPPHEALIKAYQSLVLKADEFSNVCPDFMAKIPSVTFFVGSLRCELSLNNHMAYQTSALLKDYATLGMISKFLISLKILTRNKTKHIQKLWMKKYVVKNFATG